MSNHESIEIGMEPKLSSEYGFGTGDFVQAVLFPIQNFYNRSTKLLYNNRHRIGFGTFERRRIDVSVFHVKLELGVRLKDFVKSLVETLVQWLNQSREKNNINS